jgi:cytochrome P450
MARSELHYGEWMIPANASKQNIIKYFRTNAEKQTPISMHPTSVLHDSSVYPEPHKFAPDRWFDAPSQANRCFVPFGKGARMCQGIEYV